MAQLPLHMYLIACSVQGIQIFTALVNIIQCLCLTAKSRDIIFKCKEREVILFRDLIHSSPIVLPNKLEIQLTDESIALYNYRSNVIQQVGETRTSPESKSLGRN